MSSFIFDTVNYESWRIFALGSKLASLPLLIEEWSLKCEFIDEVSVGVRA